METVRRSDNYGKPGDDEVGFCLSGKALAKKYPEWAEFSDPLVESILKSSITGQILERRFF